jgi:hypothetical protein
MSSVTSVLGCAKCLCSANIVGGNIVLALNLFGRHASGKTAKDDPDRNSGVPYHGIAMTNHRVNRDPIVGYHCLLRCVSRG